MHLHRSAISSGGRTGCVRDWRTCTRNRISRPRVWYAFPVIPCSDLKADPCPHRAPQFLKTDSQPLGPPITSMIVTEWQLCMHSALAVPYLLQRPGPLPGGCLTAAAVHALCSSCALAEATPRGCLTAAAVHALCSRFTLAEATPRGCPTAAAVHAHC